MKINWPGIWEVVKSAFVAAEPDLKKSATDIATNVVDNKSKVVGNSRLGRRYGHIKDTFNPNHKVMQVPHFNAGELPTSFSNIDLMVPIYDQLNTSSCTGNSYLAQIEAERIRQGLPALNGSRLFPYYNGRLVEGNTSQDCGAQICDVQAGGNRYGVCLESSYPFSQDNVTVQPSPLAYSEALKFKTINFQKVPQSIPVIKYLLSQRYTVNLGIQVYESFESDEVARTGIVPMPDKVKEQLMGGHAVLIIGFSDDTQTFLVRNSWGSGWGQQGGYFTLPYSYVADPSLASDLWVVEQVQSC